MQPRKTQRHILVALHDLGPTTSRDLGKAIGIDPRNAANLCSIMLGGGLIEERPNPRGRARLYAAVADVLPTDAKLVEALVDAYGASVVRRMVREAADA